MGKPRLTVIPGGRATPARGGRTVTGRRGGEPRNRRAGDGRRPPAEPIRRIPPPRLPSILTPGRSRRPRSAPGGGLSPRVWGWVFVVLGMIGVGLATWGGEPLLGAGLTAMAAAGCVAPPGRRFGPQDRAPRVAMGVAMLGIALVTLDLVLSLL